MFRPHMSDREPLALYHRTLAQDLQRYEQLAKEYQNTKQ